MFYITVKNGLLKDGHRKRMSGGSQKDTGSIWLFLWFLDKMTIIDHEKGTGKVLGGKPILFDEVAADLEISRATYKRWLALLRDAGYIDTIRTPKGLSVCVNKAFKVFGQKTEDERWLKHEPSDGSNMSHRELKHEPSNIRQDRDKRVRQEILTPTQSVVVGEKPKKATSQSESSLKKDLKKKPVDEVKIKRLNMENEVIDLFSEINPGYVQYFKRPAQRESARRLYEQYGLDAVKRVIGLVKKNADTPYFPGVKSPMELEEKYVSIENFFKKEIGRRVRRAHVII